MRSRWPGITAALVVLSLTVSGLAGAGAARHSATTPSVLTFTDPQGDSSSAPDITNVTLTGDASTGRITFAVTATGLMPSTPDGLARFVDFYLNTDRNSSTGSPGGHEYDLYVWTHPTTPPNTFWWSVDQWNGSGYDPIPTISDVTASGAVDTYQLTIPTSDLGGASVFSLDVTSGVYTGDGTSVASDDATGSFSWVYDISGPSKTMTKLVAPTIGKAVLAPAQARAGKRVTVTFPVAWTPDKSTVPLAAGTMVCDPSVAGKVIPHAESFRNGVARLSFMVPKTMRGKTLKVKVTITPPALQQQGSGVWVDPGLGETGLMATVVKGLPATRIVTVRIH